MLSIEIEFKDERRIEIEEISHFNFPCFEDSGSQFLTIYNENGELLYAVNASEILVMAVKYDDEEKIEEDFNSLNRAFEDSTVETNNALSEIQKFLQTNGFNV